MRLVALHRVGAAVAQVDAGILEAVEDPSPVLQALPQRWGASVTLPDRDADE